MSTQDWVCYILALVAFVIAAVGTFTRRYAEASAFGWVGLALVTLAALI